MNEIPRKWYIAICVPQRMNPNDFGTILALTLLPRQIDFFILFYFLLPF